jgi:recombination protein RecT
MSNGMKDLAKQSANKQQLAKQGTLSVVKSLLAGDQTKKRFEEILGQKAPQYMASLTSLVSSSTNFNDVDGNTIIASALIAATLDLPINPSLGFAYIIPYNVKVGDAWVKKAQFQMGYKSFIQLALRTALYQTINATEVYEGELTSRNRLTGDCNIDETKKSSDKIIGYAAYFRLLNGFQKVLYMTTEQVQSHGKRFSKSYDNKDGLWKKDFHSMAMKTVLKLLLSKYGILSVEMQKAIVADQAIVDESGNVTEYPDSLGNEVSAEVVVEQWENPTWIIEQIQQTETIEEFNIFITKHKSKIESIGGKDGELIEQVKKDHATKLSKK